MGAYGVYLFNINQTTVLKVHRILFTTESKLRCDFEKGVTFNIGKYFKIQFKI